VQGLGGKTGIVRRTDRCSVGWIKQETESLEGGCEREDAALAGAEGDNGASGLGRPAADPGEVGDGRRFPAGKHGESAEAIGALGVGGQARLGHDSRTNSPPTADRHVRDSPNASF